MRDKKNCNVPAPEWLVCLTNFTEAHYSSAMFHYGAILLSVLYWGCHVSVTLLPKRITFIEQCSKIAKLYSLLQIPFFLILTIFLFHNNFLFFSKSLSCDNITTAKLSFGDIEKIVHRYHHCILVIHHSN